MLSFFHFLYSSKDNIKQCFRKKLRFHYVKNTNHFIYKNSLSLQSMSSPSYCLHHRLLKFPNCCVLISSRRLTTLWCETKKIFQFSLLARSFIIFYLLFLLHSVCHHKHTSLSFSCISFSLFAKLHPISPSVETIQPHKPITLNRRESQLSVRRVKVLSNQFHRRNRRTIDHQCSRARMEITGRMA